MKKYLFGVVGPIRTVEADDETSGKDEEEVAADVSGKVRGVRLMELEVAVIELVEADVVMEEDLERGRRAAVCKRKTSKSPKCLTGDHSL